MVDWTKWERGRVAKDKKGLLIPSIEDQMKIFYMIAFRKVRATMRSIKDIRQMPWHRNTEIAADAAAGDEGSDKVVERETGE